MLIRVKTDIILDVKNEDEAEEACNALNALDNVLRNNNFQYGEVIQADVDHYEPITDAEAEEMGLVE